ncbi:MAG: tryptophan synthase subunit alpha, partial [Chloroflexi bacterium]|nr:tryptophan synthase subunit alpha [Chloroflexota bacterium]
MSRISEVFAGARRRGEAVLIPYITAGYPDVATNERIILELFRSGAGVVELGIPFSDPLADGPTIQRAGTAALAMGVTMSTCLEIAGRVHSQVDSPIILMGYFNTILSYGIEKFTAGASAAGVAGVIVPDLPPEEAGDLREVCSRQGIDLVFLLAPASTDERVQLVASQSAGFVYCVSVAGVTGARAEMPAGLEDFVERVRGRANLPLADGPTI